MVSVLNILGVSPSGYYSYKNRKPSNQIKKKKIVKKEIIEIYEESKKIYGAPKITEKLKALGYVTSQRTVSKYMKES